MRAFITTNVPTAVIYSSDINHAGGCPVIPVVKKEFGTETRSLLNSRSGFSNFADKDRATPTP